MLKKVIIFILILIIMIPVAGIGFRGVFTTGDIRVQYPYLFAGIGIASVFIIGLSYKTLFMKKTEKIKKEKQVII